jgi:hypothetical protein
MTALLAGGRPIPAALDLIRRYCGLPWRGGEPETWAYRYFDVIEDSQPTGLRPVDVLVTSALHPSLRQVDLAWFWEHAVDLTQLLGDLPLEADLATADPEVVARIQALGARLGDARVDLSLLTKVLHRKRPALVPMLDRAMLDRYRAKLPARGIESWSDLVLLLRDDLRRPDNRSALAATAESLSTELSVVPTALRLVDIAVWMSARGRQSGRTTRSEEGRDD